jgi:pimeloyl-ACP methyl ester carboxylesterase
MAYRVSGLRVLAAVLGLVGVVSLSACADMPRLSGREKLSNTAATGKLANAGEVYLIRGGFNIFSTGMDELAAKMRENGITANAYGHVQWEQVAADARARYLANHGAIVLIGHSWGVPAAVLISRRLAETSTPVALMILYDSTDPLVVPANVKRVINLRSKDAIGRDIRITGGYGFGGVIEVEDRPQYGHLDIDNAVALHDENVAEVLQLLQKQKRKR